MRDQSSDAGALFLDFRLVCFLIRACEENGSDPEDYSGDNLIARTWALVLALRFNRSPVPSGWSSSASSSEVFGGS